MQITKFYQKSGAVKKIIQIYFQKNNPQNDGLSKNGYIWLL